MNDTNVNTVYVAVQRPVFHVGVALADLSALPSASQGNCD